MVGMQSHPHDEFLSSRSFYSKNKQLDNQLALRLKNKLAHEFREQLITGSTTNQDEVGFRNLANQIKEKKVRIKLFLKHPLHAKLYLLFRNDHNNPITGYLGSSNLTQSGLSFQGELNIDILDQDACNKLTSWFEDRWNEDWCIDISDELAKILDESWARKEPIPPYHIYIKMAYHLSNEARVGLTEFRIPNDFKDKLLDFQTSAVKIAAHHLNKRGGVMIGDVVGLGKTLMATALARVFEDDFGLETLIICPKNLVNMWEDYVHEYRMRARVLSIGKVINSLPDMRRFRLLIIDESHNLRNREGKRYRSLQEYIRKNDCKCILLTATPYNKEYFDLSSQLKLFVPEDMDLGIRPENYIRLIGGETEYLRKHQSPIRSLAAMEQSEFVDDWRELMRLFLIRRTRSFIQKNYSKTDSISGRKYLTFSDGTKSFFPIRKPKTIKFIIDEQYSRLYADDVVDTINSLELPRYGLGKYIISSPSYEPSDEEILIRKNLSRLSGKRLKGFCRTHLIKRLESSGYTFLLSIEWHLLRNYIYLHAIENQKDIPIGTIDLGQFDTNSFDQEFDSVLTFEDEVITDEPQISRLRSDYDFRKRAAQVYNQYEYNYHHKFQWVNIQNFNHELLRDLDSDTNSLRELLEQFGTWNSSQDEKLGSLFELLNNSHSKDKVIIFSQFADTVHYLFKELSNLSVTRISTVTGNSEDPTKTVQRFSPKSNGKSIPKNEQLRVLVATDVVSEGQNLQDCSIVVNYDLPWAIIRLIQRAGRVDRIGQNSPEIICYSFLPADGINKLINLRGRVLDRLKQNAEIVGSDESFFEEGNEQVIQDLYHEKAKILEGEDDTEVDLSSFAYQIWKNATDKDTKLKKTIESLPSVVYTSKSYDQLQDRPQGVLAYFRTPLGNDTLAWVNLDGKSVTENQFEILRTAQCLPETPALPRHETHHKLVTNAMEHIVSEEKTSGGQLGRPTGARFKTYERLKYYYENSQGTLFNNESLRRVIDDLFRFPLQQAAVDTLNRQLRSGISDQSLAELTITLRNEGKFCIDHQIDNPQEPQIICSMGLIS